MINDDGPDLWHFAGEARGFRLGKSVAGRVYPVESGGPRAFPTRGQASECRRPDPDQSRARRRGHQGTECGCEGAGTTTIMLSGCPGLVIKGAPGPSPTSAAVRLGA